MFVEKSHYPLFNDVILTVVCFPLFLCTYCRISLDFLLLLFDYCAKLYQWIGRGSPQYLYLWIGLPEALIFHRAISIVRYIKQKVASTSYHTTQKSRKSFGMHLLNSPCNFTPYLAAHNALP